MIPMHVTESWMNRVIKRQENNSEVMEVKQTAAAKSDIKDSDIEEEVTLPGFRFHPTDEELVGFYLRRKVESKLRINMELIKQLDIYKYDPWDLPKVSTMAGDHKEWYFFCIRERKYKNSARPNRVTRSGFWKATGIDKPVYSTTATKSQSSLHHDCVGLKKCLVYYRGSAGKGTKTDWMMHEFRLPPTWKTTPNHLPSTHHEAEVWTLCRIFKRTSNYKKYLPEVKHNIVSLSYGDASSKACSSLESENSTDDHSTSFKNMSFQQENNNVEMGEKQMDVRNQHLCISQQNATSQFPLTLSSSSFWNTNNLEEYLFSDGKWDELKSIVDLATDPSIVYRCK